MHSVLPHQKYRPPQLLVRVQLPEGVPGDHHFSPKGSHSCDGDIHYIDHFFAQRQVHLQIWSNTEHTPIRLPTASHHDRRLRGPKNCELCVEKSEIFKIGPSSERVRQEDSNFAAEEEAQCIAKPKPVSN